MTRDEHIIKLGACAKAALKELSDAITAAAPDAEKEDIANRFNKISDAIAQAASRIAVTVYSIARLTDPASDRDRIE